MRPRNIFSSKHIHIVMAMAAQLGMMISLLASCLVLAEQITANAVPFNRQSFPHGFVFGTASSAYQYEGEWNKSNKGPNIWDTFTHVYPERIADHSNGDVAIDFYHLYQDDIQRMKKMNWNAFRFSIAWSRIIPSGKLSQGVNQEGIDFYNDLIDELKRNDLEPFVTLFHWDTPQALEDAYGSFLSPCIIDDYLDYADLCFRTFGDRVKYWITFNEPTTIISGYESGAIAPGRCSVWVNRACQAGDSATEPYIVAHNLLVAHAQAVKLYREKYQAAQGGKIGITLVSFWYEPYGNSTADLDAVKRELDFTLGWFMDPITNGDYPRIMKDLVGDRLPPFSCHEKLLLKNSYDFLGLNYYGAFYAANDPYVDPYHVRYLTDSQVTLSAERNGVPIGPQGGSSWLHIYPKGIRYLLNYTKDTYKNPTIYITENGVDELNNSSLTPEQALSDPLRIHYYHTHLKNTLGSIKHYGVDVKGYFAWSFADNFEWSNGYTVRFGLFYINYTNGLKREPKTSVKWFTQFLKPEGPAPWPLRKTRLGRGPLL